MGLRPSVERWLPSVTGSTPANKILATTSVHTGPRPDRSRRECYPRPPVVGGRSRPKPHAQGGGTRDKREPTAGHSPAFRGESRTGSDYPSALTRPPIAMRCPQSREDGSCCSALLSLTVAVGDRDEKGFDRPGVTKPLMYWRVIVATCVVRQTDRPSKSRQALARHQGRGASSLGPTVPGDSCLDTQWPARQRSLWFAPAIVIPCLLADGCNSWRMEERGGGGPARDPRVSEINLFKSMLREVRRSCTLNMSATLRHSCNPEVFFVPGTGVSDKTDAPWSTSNGHPHVCL